MQIRIVDTAIQYDCPYDGESYILVIRNTLYVPSMKNNLLPPFIMRQEGIKLNDTPKIQVDAPTVKEHSIIVPRNWFLNPVVTMGYFFIFPHMQTDSNNNARIR
jgi:hypothetical protein